VAKKVSRPPTQGPSKLQGWKQGLASQKEHCYHSPMCQVGLQAPRTFQNRQIGWSSGLPVELPPQFKIHNVFHVSLLEPYHENRILEHHQEPPAPIEIESQKEFEV